jgi:Competence-damaged protein
MGFNAYIEPMNDLLPLAETIAARLKARSETIAVAESSTGGLISAALLAVPGASAYFLGGAIVYTRQAKSLLLAMGDGVPSRDRAARVAAGAARPGAIRGDMGTWRNRRRRAERQSLWRSSRTHLFRDRGNDRAGAHAGNRPLRPPRQYAGVRGRGSRTAGRHLGALMCHARCSFSANQCQKTIGNCAKISTSDQRKGSFAVTRAVSLRQSETAKERGASATQLS